MSVNQDFQILFLVDGDAAKQSETSFEFPVIDMGLKMEMSF